MHNANRKQNKLQMHMNPITDPFQALGMESMMGYRSLHLNQWKLYSSRVEDLEVGLVCWNDNNGRVIGVDALHSNVVCFLL